MAIGDVTIRISADSSTLQADVERARQRLNRLSGAATDVSRSMGNAGSAYNKFGNALKDTAMYGGAFMLLAGLVQIPVSAAKAADSYTNINSKLKLATKSTEELTYAHDRLFAIAQATRTEFGDTVSLYSNLAIPLGEAGKSQQEMLKFTELVSQALKISGSDASEAASTIKQLGQAMSSGVLRGDEFNSLMENNKALVKALADGLGKKTGDLRAMAEAGLLKSEVVFDAVMSQADQLGLKFKQMAPTMQEAWVTVGNTMLLEIGKLDQATGASAAIAKNLMSLGKNMDDVFSGAGVALGLLSALMVGRGVTSLTSYAAAKVTAATAARALSIADAQASAATAAAAVRSAEATMVDAAAREARVVAARADAIANLAAARGTDFYAAAVARLQAAHVAAAAAQAASATARAGLTAATATATAATNGLSAAQAAATVTGRGMAAASALGSGALAMLGGPAGLAMLAAVGIYYLSSALDENRKSIKLADGSYRSLADAVADAKAASAAYMTATGEEREEIKKTNQERITATKLLIEESQATLELARTRLTTLQSLKVSESGSYRDGTKLAATEADGLIAGQINQIAAAQKQLDSTASALKKIQTENENLGKSSEELRNELDKTPESYEASARAGLANAEATKKSTAATTAAAPPIKSLIESLGKQRIELEHGKLAAEYYTNRLNGLTDAEARSVGKASQYTSYLEERKRVTREATLLTGGLRTAYEQKLADTGLGDADKQFNAAKSATDRAVEAANAYAKSIQAITEAAKSATTAVGGMANAQPSSVPLTVSTSTAAPNQFDVSKVSNAAARNPQVIAVIDRVSKESGIDAAMMKTMAYIESRFNSQARNSDSGASGTYQFVGRTSAQYGLSGKEMDAEANTRAYVRLLQDNAKALKTFGIEVTSANLYLAHQQGADGLRQIINEAKGRGSVADNVRTNMRGNPSGGDDSTAANFLANWTAKYNQLEATVKGVVPSVAAVAVEAKKATDATANSVPIWDELNAKSTQINRKTAEYAGVIDGDVVTAAMRAKLVQDEMDNNAGKLVEAAKQHTLALTATGYAIRDNELAVLEYDKAQRQTVLTAESALAYAEEERNLRREMAAIEAPGPMAAYRRDLSDKTLDNGQIERLTGLKAGIEFKRINAELDEQALKLRSTNEEWRQHELTLLKIPSAEQAMIIAKEHGIQSLTRMNESVGQLRSSFEGDLLNSLTSGELGFKSFADAVINEAMRMMVVKPLMDSLFGSISGGGSGGGGVGGLFGAIMGSFGVMHTGGGVGAGNIATRSASPVIFANAPRYHAGGIIGTDEVPAILQKGEGVFTREQMAMLSPAGQGVTVNVAPAQVVIQPIEGEGTKQRVEQRQNNDGTLSIKVISEAVQQDMVSGWKNGASSLGNFADSRFMQKRGN